MESSLIDAALAPLTPEAALERARAVARRRLPVLRRGRADRLAARLGDYLSRRGYAPAVVVRVVRECAGAGVDG